MDATKPSALAVGEAKKVDWEVFSKDLLSLPPELQLKIYKLVRKEFYKAPSPLLRLSRSVTQDAQLWIREIFAMEVETYESKGKHPKPTCIAGDAKHWLTTGLGEICSLDVLSGGRPILRVHLWPDCVADLNVRIVRLSKESSSYSLRLSSNSSFVQYLCKMDKEEKKDVELIFADRLRSSIQQRKGCGLAKPELELIEEMIFADYWLAK